MNSEQSKLQSESKMYFKISQKYEIVSNTFCSIPLFGRSYEDAVKRYQNANKDQAQMIEIEQQFAKNDKAVMKFLQILVDTIPLYTIPVRTVDPRTRTLDSGGNSILLMLAKRVLSEMPAKFRIAKELVAKSFGGMGGAAGVGKNALLENEFILYLRGSLNNFVQSTQNFGQKFVGKIPPKTLSLMKTNASRIGNFLKVFGNAVLAYQSFCTLANVLAASTKLVALEIQNKIYKDQINLFTTDKCAYLNSKSYLEISSGQIDWCESNFANVNTLRDQVNKTDLIAGKVAKITKCYSQSVKGIEVFPVNNIVGVPGFRQARDRLSISRHFGKMGVTALKYSEENILMAQVISRSKNKDVTFWTYVGALELIGTCTTPGASQLTP